MVSRGMVTLGDRGNAPFTTGIDKDGLRRADIHGIGNHKADAAGIQEIRDDAGGGAGFGLPDGDWMHVFLSGRSLTDQIGREKTAESLCKQYTIPVSGIFEIFVIFFIRNFNISRYLPYFPGIIFGKCRK